jgi:hypothetical protein
MNHRNHLDRWIGTLPLSSLGTPVRRCQKRDFNLSRKIYRAGTGFEG